MLGLCAETADSMWVNLGSLSKPPDHPRGVSVHAALARYIDIGDPDLADWKLRLPDGIGFLNRYHCAVRSDSGD
jgi:hypothetical protein